MGYYPKTTRKCMKCGRASRKDVYTSRQKHRIGYRCCGCSRFEEDCICR